MEGREIGIRVCHFSSHGWKLTDDCPDNSYIFKGTGKANVFDSDCWTDTPRNGRVGAVKDSSH